MNRTYVTSDWHFGHKGVTKFRTNFASMEDMEEVIIERYLEVVTKEDTVYCIGDMAFDQRGLNKIAKLPGRKILIRGNHDKLDTYSYLAVFDSVEGAYRYKKYWMTHIPIHPSELFRGKNIHGHCHKGGPSDHQKGEQWHDYFNAILEYNDYRPVLMQDVSVKLQQQHQAAHPKPRRERHVKSNS